MNGMTRVMSGVALFLSVGCGQNASVAATFGSDAWRKSSVWDDGQAEYAVYDVEWARYGGSFPGRATLLVVKEPWAPDLDVKADILRDDGFDVLKLNHVRHVRTGIYDYHQMASVFARRDRGNVVKMSTSSAEACGLCTASLRKGRLETRSYWDEQGDRSEPYPAGALPEDGLPLLLRDLVTGPLPKSLLVFPTLLTGKFQKLVAKTVPLARQAKGKMATKVGEREVIEIVVGADAAKSVYRFDAASPHPLLEMISADGTIYRIAKIERIAYWEKNVDGGERWWPEHLRSR